MVETGKRESELTSSAALAPIQFLVSLNLAMCSLSLFPLMARFKQEIVARAQRKASAGRQPKAGPKGLNFVHLAGHALQGTYISYFLRNETLATINKR